MIAIINYGIGNLASILNMLKRLGKTAVITADKTEVKKAGKLIIPGIGHFDQCMLNFNKSGFRELVEERVLQGRVPVLGICVGAQMMTAGSEEGAEKGLGWVDAETIRFNIPDQPQLKIPHMGWTDVQLQSPSVLLKDFPQEPRFYFVHSYHFRFSNPAQVIATAHYGYDFPCAFQHRNIFGVQFHPEKSHRFGMKLLENFANL
jgi:imidazole glycerol-phosphate synthase subunit HisH